MCAQIVHAAGESAISPIPPNTNAIVLACANERELRELAKKLSLAGVQHTVIQEVDPPYCGQVTAIGIVPVKDKKEVKKLLSNYPLLREATGT